MKKVLSPASAIILTITVGLFVLLQVRDRQDEAGGKVASAKPRMEGQNRKPSVRGGDPKGVSARPPRLFRVNPQIHEDDSGAGENLKMLGGGAGSARERVAGLQAMRGTPFSENEARRSLGFLSGQSRPEGMPPGEIHWLVDELLTTLRLQNPPQEDLAMKLVEVAFQTSTDPVIRDYIMQHLGHLWEQYGAREEIEVALWKALDTGDETTPGSALIALSRGYERDDKPKSLAKLRERAMELARNPATPLASRVTALAIAGEDQSKAASEFAEGLVKEPNTPLILRKVAENVLAR